MKSLLNLGPGARLVLSFVLFTMMFIATYAGWALHRSTAGLLEATENPQPFPHPDDVIWQLNDWYDRRYPVAPGSFKLHGELDRVRWTFLAVLALSALVSLVLIQLVLAPWLFPPKRIQSHLTLSIRGDTP